MGYTFPIEKYSLCGFCWSRTVLLYLHWWEQCALFISKSDFSFAIDLICIQCYFYFWISHLFFSLLNKTKNYFYSIEVLWMQETEINVKYLHQAVKSEDMICFCLLVIKKNVCTVPTWSGTHRPKGWDDRKGMRNTRKHPLKGNCLQVIVSK